LHYNGVISSKRLNTCAAPGETQSEKLLHYNGVISSKRLNTCAAPGETQSEKLLHYNGMISSKRLNTCAAPGAAVISAASSRARSSSSPSLRIITRLPERRKFRSFGVSFVGDNMGSSLCDAGLFWRTLSRAGVLRSLFIRLFYG
jgi:hypothetical protein